jgi:hypothetical protein
MKEQWSVPELPLVFTLNHRNLLFEGKTVEIMAIMAWFTFVSAVHKSMVKETRNGPSPKLPQIFTQLISCAVI